MEKKKLCVKKTLAMRVAFLPEELQKCRANCDGFNTDCENYKEDSREVGYNRFGVTKAYQEIYWMFM